MYPTASKELLEGCKCGSHFFFFVKEKEIAQLQKETENLTAEDKKEIEEDVREIIGLGDDELQPIILDLESIRIIKPGKFEIDLVSLFKKKPLVYKVEDGRYIIDLATTFYGKKQEEKGNKL